MVIIDTNVILRHLLADHPDLTSRAHRFFEPVKRGETQAFLLESVVAECVYVLAGVYQASREDIVNALSRVLNYRGVVMDRWQAVRRALTIYADSRLDFVDALLLALSRSESWELFSFDKEIAPT